MPLYRSFLNFYFKNYQPLAIILKSVYRTYIGIIIYSATLPVLYYYTELYLI